MDLMNLKATLKEEISTKSGKPYNYVSIILTPTLEKKVFLEPAEVECLKIQLQKNINSKEN